MWSQVEPTSVRFQNRPGLNLGRFEENPAASLIAARQRGVRVVVIEDVLETCSQACHLRCTSLAEADTMAFPTSLNDDRLAVPMNFVIVSGNDAPADPATHLNSRALRLSTSQERPGISCLK